MNGIKEITTYKKNELGQTVKTVQKVKVSKKTVRVSRTGALFPSRGSVNHRKTKPELSMWRTTASVASR